MLPEGVQGELQGPPRVVQPQAWSMPRGHFVTQHCSLSSLKWAGFGGFPGPRFFVIQGANLGIELAPSRGSQKE